MTYVNSITDAPTAVYFVFDLDDQLLYVGMSINPTVRINGHSHKTWWSTAKRVEIEWHGNRAAAEVAERHAIETRNPRYNGTYAVRVLPQPAPIFVVDDDRASLSRVRAARKLGVPESVVIRCAELGWLVPVHRVSPGAKRGRFWYSHEAVEEFGRRWNAGEYRASFPDRGMDVA